MKDHNSDELYLVHDDNLEIDPSDREMTEEEKIEFEELKKKYGIK